MDPVAVASLCALLSHAPGLGATGPGLHCPASVVLVSRPSVRPNASAGLMGLARIVNLGDGRDGIARVAYAEAANQGDSGLAGVVYTILNRLADGQWGDDVDAVLNAPHQFEPVMRAGGDWRNLPDVTATRQARIDTILNLALEGRLPDLTNGARYFQNPRIVADRAAAGEVAPGLVNFGGAPPSAVIGAHSFYVAAGGRGGGRRPHGVGIRASRAAADSIFVAENAGELGGGSGPNPRSDIHATPAANRESGDHAERDQRSPTGPMFVFSTTSGDGN